MVYGIQSLILLFVLVFSWDTGSQPVLLVEMVSEPPISGEMT